MGAHIGHKESEESDKVSLKVESKVEGKVEGTLLVVGTGSEIVEAREGDKEKCSQS